MTYERNPDIDLLLGEAPCDDPERRAELAARLAPDLDNANEPPVGDIARLAAYLDGELDAVDKQAFYAQLYASGAALAELRSAIDLIAVVENAQQRPSAELMARAAPLVEPQKTKSAPQSCWRLLLKPRVQMRFGLAFASLVAFAVWGPIAKHSAFQSAPEPSISGGGSSVAALGGGKPASHWGAVAISPDDKVYGTAQGFPTQGDAERGAVNECKDRHGRSCAVAASGAGKCFAVVSQAEGAPIAAANANITDAGNQALAICNGGRPNVVVCTMLTSFCTDEHPQAVIDGPEGDDREKPISK